MDEIEVDPEEEARYIQRDLIGRVGYVELGVIKEIVKSQQRYYDEICDESRET